MQTANFPTHNNNNNDQHNSNHNHNNHILEGAWSPRTKRKNKTNVYPQSTSKVRSIGRWAEVNALRQLQLQRHWHLEVAFPQQAAPRRAAEKRPVSFAAAASAMLRT